MQQIIHPAFKGTIGTAGYAAYARMAQKNDVSLASIPAMRDYIQYTLLSESINAEQFSQELMQLEQALFSRHAETKAEKDLLRQSRAVYLMGKLLDFSLTPVEWDEYKKTVCLRD